MATPASAQDIPDVPCQPRNLNFPFRVFGKFKHYRAFQEYWFDNWKWLHYDIDKDLVFCHPCLICVKSGVLKTGSPPTKFATTGYCHWLNATKDFKHHELTTLHQNALAIYKTVKQSSIPNVPDYARLVAVGDKECGKTELLECMRGNQRSVTLHVDNYQIKLFIYDTNVDEAYDHIRPTIYSEADVILLIFSIYSPESFHNIETKWIREVASFSYPEVKIILVGNKQDVRIFDNEKDCVPYEECLELARKIGAHTYMECSVSDKHEVKDVLFTAARAVMDQYELN